MFRKPPWPTIPSYDFDYGYAVVGRTEKAGGETVLFSLEAPLFDVVVAADTVRELVADDAAVAESSQR